MSGKKRPAEQYLPEEIFIVHRGQFSGEEPGFDDASDAVAHAQILANADGAMWFVARYQNINSRSHTVKPRAAQ